MRTPRETIRDHALAQGFDAVGFAPAALDRAASEGLHEFLSAGCHGDMGWMESRAAERAQPTTLWPEAKTAIVVGLSYAPATDPLAGLQKRASATISVYAHGADYHDVIKKRLKTIARAIVA